MPRCLVSSCLEGVGTACTVCIDTLLGTRVNRTKATLISSTCRDIPSYFEGIGTALGVHVDNNTQYHNRRYPRLFLWTESDFTKRCTMIGKGRSQWEYECLEKERVYENLSYMRTSNSLISHENSVPSSCLCMSEKESLFCEEG